jgi:hypothetical protein
MGQATSPHAQVDEDTDYGYRGGSSASSRTGKSGGAMMSGSGGNKVVVLASGAVVVITTASVRQLHAISEKRYRNYVFKARSRSLRGR